MGQASFRHVAIGLSVLVFLGACARSEPARFYPLRPLAGGDLGQLSHTVPSDEDAEAIGMESAELAAYLNRPEIAVRGGPYEVHFADFDRCPRAFRREHLDENIAQVLADNLSRLLHSQNIQVFPRATGAQLDYRVSVYVMRFDNEPGVGALLRAHWTLWDGDKRDMLVAREEEYREPLQKQDYESIAAADSRLLANLSRDIAETVCHLPKKLFLNYHACHLATLRVRIYWGLEY
ncbi:MAG: membrane integrity-associated transporter subunit PqiC [Gammaproteobacteria bacterium]